MHNCQTLWKGGPLVIPQKRKINIVKSHVETLNETFCVDFKKQHSYKISFHHVRLEFH